MVSRWLPQTRSEKIWASLAAAFVLVTVGSWTLVPRAIQSLKLSQTRQFPSVITEIQETDGVETTVALDLNERAYETLEENGVPRAIAEDYDKRFIQLSTGNGWRRIEDMFDAGIMPTTANAYPDRFSAEGVVSLDGCGVFSGTALSFEEASIDRPGPFHYETICAIVENGRDSTYVELYEKRFSGTQVGQLIEAEISPDQANAYPEDSILHRGYRALHIIAAYDAGLDGLTAAEYPSELELYARARLWIEGATPDFVKNLNGNVTHPDVIIYAKEIIDADNGINVGILNQFLSLNREFGARISIADVVDYKQKGISYDQVRSEAQEAWVERTVRRK